jgi:hypothetical protein
VPDGFAAALSSLRRAVLRPEIVLDEAPAPQRLAPFSLALTADVIVAGDEVGTGRLVVLHDPDGQDVWAGRTRMVAYVKAECEPEMVADPMLPGVGWAWLTEALEAHGATFAAASGTVTRVTSESFGGLSGNRRTSTAELELRASWTPLDDNLARHVEAWGDVLCAAAGLPPVPPEVTTLPRSRRH